MNHCDFNRKTPRKSDLVPSYAKKSSSNSRFYLLSRRAILMQNKKEIENWSLMNKAVYSKKESTQNKIDCSLVSQTTNCQSQI